MVVEERRPAPHGRATPDPSSAHRVRHEAGSDRLEEIRRALLGAAGTLWRDLPWRATRDPWRVLVSEMMLQQTQVARVVGPYGRFVARFPTPRACASAPQAEVVREWAGLGYNRRARYLHQASVVLVERHGGRVPPDPDALRSLPGVGSYTASAVMAFAFGAVAVPVDTNVARVVARAVAGRRCTPKEVRDLAGALAPAAPSAWTFSQLLFDLGAAHCSARNPACTRCPIRASCSWAAAGCPSPDPAARREMPQTRFFGSDREGRGRLVDALRRGPLRAVEIAPASGWPDDEERAQRVSSSLVNDGLARWTGTSLVLG